MKRIIYLFVSFLFCFSIIFSATTGKVAGTITDAETGEPLVGVNVVVEGTSMGAATDNDGNFVITNISPGTYNLRASMIGYTRTTVKMVRVEIDQTTEIDIQMSQEVIEGEAVEVIAQRRVIKKDVAGSQKSVSADEIERLPASDVGEVIGLKAGITSGLSIRGSASSEALFSVDGITLRDERTNEPMMSLPLSSMQEVSVQTGGLSAQYSNVRSGVVNVVTKEGSKDYYSGTVTMRYSPAERKHFGISPYNPNSTWLRPFLDENVCWEGTKNGYWNEFEQRQYQQFNGWNALSQSLLSDDNEANDMTAAGAKRLFEWQYRKEGYIQSPDRTIDLGLGGPVPGGKKLGNLRFFLSHRNKKEMYLMHLSREGLTDQSTMLKVTSDISSSTKLTLQGIYGEIDATTRSRSGGTDYFNSTWEVASEVNQGGFTVPWRVYMNTYWCPTTKFYSVLSGKLNKVVNSGTYYTLQAKRIQKKYHTDHGAYRDTTDRYDIFPGPLDYRVDEAPEGFWPQPVSSIDGGLMMGGAVSTSRDFSKFVTYQVQFDYVSQINFRHQLRTGFKFEYDNFEIDFGMQNEFLPEGNYWTNFNRQPFLLTAYIEDKIEYEGWITTIGLIPEYYIFNGQWYDVSRFGPKDFFSQNYQPEYEDEYKTLEVDPKLYLSPRLAISHPITANSKLFFNYGHYREIPEAENHYQLQRKFNGQVDYIGDPTLPFTRTISYEVGFDQSLFDTYLLHVSAYYKSIDNETAWTDYFNMDGKVAYNKLTANHYEDIRGFELEFIKRYGDWLTGMVNFEYRLRSHGYFGLGAYFENPSEQSDYDRRNPYRQYWYPAQPRFKGNIDFHTPENYGPSIANQHPLGGWHFNFILSFTGGYAVTWNPNNVPGIQYNLTSLPYQNIDLKAAKVFRFNNIRVKVFADVYNLLNYKYFNDSFTDYHDYRYYMESLHLPEDMYDQLQYNGIPGDDHYGEYRKKGVEHQPMSYTDNYMNINNPNPHVIYYDGAQEDYFQYQDGNWVAVDNKTIDQILEDRAYIDMPNQSYITFLTPRDIFMGMTVSFDLK